MPAGLPVEDDCGGVTEIPDPVAAEAFGREQPLILDLGCGNGVFLSALAARDPGWNILGIEKKGYRVRQARRRLAGYENARVVHGEVMEVLPTIRPASVSRVYLLFNDPWPKRRHAVRRLVQPEFVDRLSRCLEADGLCFFASDSPDYGRWARNIFAACGWRVGPWTVPPDWPRTEFEQRFAAAGLNIMRFQAIR
jgi:tRNA (guanine-N7-)-methyltransferase